MLKDSGRIQANAGDCGKPTAGDVIAAPGYDLLFHIADLAMILEIPCAVPDQVRRDEA
jgi:hypothetical protein